MNRQKRKCREIGICAAIAFTGFLLMLTEKNGGIWAGTFAGFVLLTIGAVVLLRAKRNS